VKRILLLAILSLALISTACDKQKAVKSIVEDPQMKSIILSQLLGDQQTKAQLADSIFADQIVIDKLVAHMAQNELTRTQLLDNILQADTSGQWLLAKLAADPNMKLKMKEAVK
jgi:hypothetical protein